MVEMIYIGTRALNFSTKIALEEEPKEILKNEEKKEEAENSYLVATLILGGLLSLFLFKFIPLWITEFLNNRLTIIQEHYFLYNLIDGFIKTVIFLIYMWILSSFPDMKRVFMYHGAEHKSIIAYENGCELNVENARKQTRFHPRCGTSFIIIVFLFSILVFTLFPKNPDFLTNFIIRVALLPIIAGISYEFLKISAKYAKSTLVHIIALPGLWTQHLTTSEPTDDMLEVALRSLKMALSSEENLIKSSHE